MERWYPMAAQTLATAWQRRWLLIATAWAVCLVGWVGVAAIPNIYESDARLYVNADAVLTPLLHGLAIDTATPSRLETMQKTLLSRPNLDKLIGMTDFERHVRSPEQRQLLVMNLMKAIRVDSQGDNIFTIAYRNSDPKLAHDVVAALLSIFVEEATRGNRTDMRTAQNFLSQQIASYEVQLREAEQRRAAFRGKYLDILPLQSAGGLSRLDGARVQVQGLNAQLRDADARLAALQRQASLTPATLDAATAGAGEPPLVAAERHLAELRAQYTEQNPDVIIARRLVASLRASAQNKPTQAVTGRGVPNPLYQQVQLQLVEAQSAVSSLKAELATAQKDLDRMEALARAAPGVEAQYQNLDRDYTVIQHNYEELLARREASNITQAADTDADKVQLRVVDPPTMPIVPVAPNRVLLVSLVLCAGLGAATAAAILLSQLDRSIGDVGQLRELGVPVLGAISMQPTPRTGALSRHIAAPAVAMLVLIAVYGGLAKGLITHQRLIP